MCLFDWLEKKCEELRTACCEIGMAQRDSAMMAVPSCLGNNLHSECKHSVPYIFYHRGKHGRLEIPLRCVEWDGSA